MKLNEITKPGFYTYDLENRETIYEVINNTDEEWLKESPEETLLIDEWTQEGIDEEGRKCYAIYGGNLVAVKWADDIDVYEITDTKYTMDFIQSIQDRCNGTAMREDKPSRLELAQAEIYKLKIISEQMTKSFHKYYDESVQLENKLKKIEKKCLKEENWFTTIYDDKGNIVLENTDTAKFAKSILKIIQKADKRNQKNE